MACQTRHGPATAIKCLKDASGLRLTQSDWHLLRQKVEDNMGERLSREVINPIEAAPVASDFYDAVMTAAGKPLNPTDRDAFVASLTSGTVTAGTLHVMDEIILNGIPEEITDRPRRGSKSAVLTQPTPVAASETVSSLGVNGVFHMKTDAIVGPMGATEDADVIRSSELVESITDGGFTDSEFTPEQGVEASLVAREASDAMRANVDAIGADLAQRMKDNGISVIHDSLTGTELTPHSGYRYRGWNHEGVQSALAEEIASNRGMSSDSVSSLISSYSEYASVDGYRTSALRERGLRASSFAESVAGDKTLSVKFADRNDRIVPSSAIRGVLSSREAVQAMPEVAASARQRISTLPMEDAVREYVAVRRVERTLTRVAAGVEWDAASKIIDNGLVDGVAGYNARTTAGGEQWDAESLDRRIVPLIADKVGVESSVAFEVIRDFKAVAQVNRYKVRGLKSADIDPEDYRSKTPGKRKLAPVS